MIIKKIYHLAIASHLSSRPQRRCQLKRQRNANKSASENESDGDSNSKTKRSCWINTMDIKQEPLTDVSSDEEEMKFDPNQPSTSFAHSKY